MTTEPEHGYAALLSSLLGLRPAPATEQFDRVLAELTAAGSLEPPDAARLRWWQRESVRAVDDYVTETVPAALAAVLGAQARAEEACADAERAWQAATAPAPAHEPTPPTDPEPPHGGGPTSRRGSTEHSDTPAVIDLREGTGSNPSADTARPASPPPEPPVASGRRRLLVAGLSALPERPDPM